MLLARLAAPEETETKKDLRVLNYSMPLQRAQSEALCADIVPMESKTSGPDGGLPRIELGSETRQLLQRLVVAVETIAANHQRLASHFAPPPTDIVGTDYISSHLGCTAVWVTDMARNGQIPKSCIVAGTGDGKPWKFHRRGVDEWLSKR
jgi:hypothetical protein